MKSRELLKGSILRALCFQMPHRQVKYCFSVERAEWTSSSVCLVYKQTSRIRQVSFMSANVFTVNLIQMQRFVMNFCTCE